MSLLVRVNPDLVLNAGLVDERDGGEVVIVPPKVTLFAQVLAYLRSRPDPSPRPELTPEVEGIAAAAVALRWGSYLAVLADDAKPAWDHAGSPDTSRISNAEMARINIETSAALAEWVDLARQDPSTYEKLVGRAHALLPMPNVRPTPVGSDFALLAMPDVAKQMVTTVDADRLARAQADAGAQPSRIFANALVNVAWRNGPVEDLHTGRFRGYPLDRRRVTTDDERAVLDFAAARLSTGIEVCHGLAEERTGRSWVEQVVPYGLASAMRITPTGWTLTETTREVRLPKGCEH